MAWQGKATQAQVERERSLEKVEPRISSWPQTLPLRSLDMPRALLTPREVSLTENFSVAELLCKLSKREIGAEELTRAFLRRAAIAQQVVSATDKGDFITDF